MIGVKDILLITMSHSVSFMGKSWWLLMLGFRSLVVLLAGFSLFSDEQERFVCNTIQPGCSNLCFNTFAPVSILRLWLFHLILLFLPHVIFITYVTHKVLSRPYLRPPPSSERSSPLTIETPPSLNKNQRESGAPRYYCAYVLVIILRIFLEAAFGAGQFFLFGLSFPKSFLCYEAPCTSGVECYISRPTEKSLMLNFMLAVAALSIVISFFDLVSSLKAMVRWRKKREFLIEEISKGEESSVCTTNEDMDVLLTKRNSPTRSSKHANSEPHFPIDNTAAKPEIPSQPTPSHFVNQSQLKPPLYPRPDRGPPPPAPRAPTPSANKRLASTSGQHSDSSDSQDNRRAWV